MGCARAGTFDSSDSFAMRKFESGWSAGTHRSSPKNASTSSHGYGVSASRSYTGFGVEPPESAIVLGFVSRNSATVSPTRSVVTRSCGVELTPTLRRPGLGPGRGRAPACGSGGSRFLELLHRDAHDAAVALPEREEVARGLGPDQRAEGVGLAGDLDVL